MRPFILLLLLISTDLFSQLNKYPRLLTSVNGITYKDTDTIRVKKLQFIKNSDSILITTPAGKKITLPDNAVWGLKSDQSLSATRIYKRKYLSVSDNRIVLYSENSQGVKGGSSKILYFSKSISDQMIEFNLDNLEKTFSDNLCFLEKVRVLFKKYKGSPYFAGKIWTSYNECLK